MLILLVFFFPLALYLLVLGVINRRSRPLFVGGVWDGIGLLFATSGFLLFAGPAIFSSASERWRLYWLLGQPGGILNGPGGDWPFWIFLSLAYFVLIVGGAALLLWRRRHVTAIYNVEAERVELCLSRICGEWGLNPIRSGKMLLFGLAAENPAPAGSVTKGLDRGLTRQSAILEFDIFPGMHHVTLRWEPADAPLRSLLENELEQRLADAAPPESGLGNWFLTIACLLLAFEFAGAVLVVAVNLFHR